MAEQSPVRFDRFLLDPAARRLWRDDQPVPINARYLDALMLLVADAGKLVTKDRFMAEVWRGIPVTDDALTQCIRTLRRLLGDDPASARYIATVPKHGYRFVAAVTDDAPAMNAVSRSERWRDALRVAAAGTVGGGLAGLVGGGFYGAVATAEPSTMSGGASTLIVILWLSIAVALAGAAAVSSGIAVAQLLPGRWWPVAGGAAGGVLIGFLARMFGLDAFNLLFGHSPVGITGGVEGLVLGASVGLAVVLANGRGVKPALAIGALIGGVAGLVLIAAGGHMMIGSMRLLAEAFPGSQLRLDRLAGGPAELATGALEGALFAAGVIGGIGASRR